MKSRVTLKTVAQESGYSLATVGYILRKKQLERFSEETRKVVTETAGRLGYKPNAAARSMKADSSGTVAMVIRHERRGNHPTNVAGMEYLLGVQEALAKKGRHLILVTVDELDTRSDEGPLILRENVVDGLVVEFGIPQAVKKSIQKSGIPVVWLDAETQQQYNCVYPDEKANVAHGIDYLLDQGYENIFYTGAALSEWAHPSARLRMEAFTVERERIPGASGVILEGREDSLAVMLEKFDSFLKGLSGSRPLVMTYDLRYAHYLVFCASKLGLAIPRDVAIFSLDNAPTIQGLWPFITAIGFDRHEMGMQAGEMLLQCIEQGVGYRSRSKVYPGHVIPGESTGSNH